MESGEDGQTPSAPWERPARWENEPGEQTGRRHRYAEDTDDTTVRASELIAALRGDTDSPGAEPEAMGADAGVSDSKPEGASAEREGTEPDNAPPKVAESNAPGTEPTDLTDQGEPMTHADRPRRGWLATGRSLVAALAVMLLLVAGTEWVIKARADAVLANNQVTALDTNDANISPSEKPPTTNAAATVSAAPVVSHDYQPENILLLGSDSRASKADAALGGANKDPGGSDVVMVAHLSADRSHVTVLSIPRDTYVKAPDCKAWDYDTNSLTDKDYTSPYSIWRINATYAAGGPPCTVKAVQEMTGLRIDRVIIIDFAGFAAIVDAQGGMDVNACKPIIDGQLGTVLPKAGLQHINGKQALDLVRARKVEGDTTSDIARIKRQQKVLSTILRQATSTGVLLNPIKLNNVLQAFVHNVKADNVTLDNLLDIAQSLGNLDPRRVTFFTLPTVPDSNGVGLHATDGAALIWDALRRDAPLPGEVTEPPTPVPTTAPTTPMTTVTQPPVTKLVTSLVTTTPTAPQSLSVAPRDVNLQIVNVAGRPGVANQAQDALVSLGYAIPSNALLRPDGGVVPGMSIEYSAAHRAAALTLAATVPGATLVEKSGLGSQVRLILGSTFNAAAFSASLRQVKSGDPLPPALSTAAVPVTSTVTSTIVSTPPPIVMPMPTTSTPHTSATTLGSSDMTSVNAGAAGCI